MVGWMRTQRSNTACSSFFRQEVGRSAPYANGYCFVLLVVDMECS